MLYSCVSSHTYTSPGTTTSAVRPDKACISEHASGLHVGRAEGFKKPGAPKHLEGVRKHVLTWSQDILYCQAGKQARRGIPLVAASPERAVHIAASESQRQCYHLPGSWVGAMMDVVCTKYETGCGAILGILM